MNLHSLLGGNLDTFTIFRLCQLVGKERSGYHHRAIGTSFCHIGLQFLGKVIVTLAGDDGQDVCIKHMIAQYVGILTFTLIVHTQAHTTTHLLALFNFVGGVLEGANLEYVGIVPTFLQG